MRLHNKKVAICSGAGSVHIATAGIQCFSKIKKYKNIVNNNTDIGSLYNTRFIEIKHSRLIENLKSKKYKNRYKIKRRKKWES